jgi:hypothetical protein
VNVAEIEALLRTDHSIRYGYQRCQRTSDGKLYLRDMTPSPITGVICGWRVSERERLLLRDDLEQLNPKIKVIAVSLMRGKIELTPKQMPQRCLQSPPPSPMSRSSVSSWSAQLILEISMRAYLFTFIGVCGLLFWCLPAFGQTSSRAPFGHPQEAGGDKDPIAIVELARRRAGI